MPIAVVPTFDDDAHYEQTIVVNGATLLLRFDFQQRLNYWTLSIADAAGGPIVDGIPLAPGINLRLPPDERLPLSIWRVIGPETPGFKDLLPDGKAYLAVVTAE